MQIIIPMAGKEAHTTAHAHHAKPLIRWRKTVVQRTVEDITKVCGQTVNEIALCNCSHFGSGVEQNLIKVAEVRCTGQYLLSGEKALRTLRYYIGVQRKPLKGKTVVAFADTLFKADFVMDTEKKGVIWVQKIDDPRASLEW